MLSNIRITQVAVIEDEGDEIRRLETQAARESVTALSGKNGES
jgi:hypothetical protein